MEPIFLATLVIVAVVLIVIEWRIMRKPESERSDREKRYMAGSRKSAAGFNFFGQRIAPIVMIAAGGLLILLALPFWFQPERGQAYLLTGIAIASVVGGFAFMRFNRKHRGPDWKARQEAANRAADAEGRPRWFGWQK